MSSITILKKIKNVGLAILAVVIILVNLLSAKGNNNINTYYFKRNQYNKIALTFDDGPHPVYTRKILDLLDKYQIKATFFIIGENAGYYKETLKEIVKRGHEIGNHTFSHAIIKDKNIDDIMLEIEECRNAIYDICGENTVLFRPPGGLMSDVVSEGSELFENYDIILWSIDTMDWAHRKPEKIAEYVINNTKSGDIILMHDYIGKDSPTPDALEIIIPSLIEKGYEFVTVGELISD